MKVLLSDSPQSKLLLKSSKPAAAALCCCSYAEFLDDEPGWTIEAIHARAEAVTPILEEILYSRPPLHWGHQSAGEPR
jgi:hypothetical protein